MASGAVGEIRQLQIMCTSGSYEACEKQNCQKLCCWVPSLSSCTQTSMFEMQLLQCTLSGAVKQTA